MLDSIVLVTSDASVETEVRASCPSPTRLHVFPIEGLVNARHLISDHGQSIVDAARDTDAVLVDWSFEDAPAINTLCYHIRREQLAPVVAICRGGREAMTACMATGSDDALALPLYLPYLEATIMSYRRLVDATSAWCAGAGGGLAIGELDAEPAADDSPTSKEMDAGPLRLDLSAHRVFISDHEIELTPREFALLRYLVSRAGELCTRDDILSQVWGIDFDTGTNMVDVYMHYVRRKLEAHGLEGMIQTVRGLGYRLESIS